MIWILVIVLAGVAAFLAYLLLRQRAAVPASAPTPAPAPRAKAEVVVPAVATPVAAKPAPSSGKYWGKQFIVMDPEASCPQARELHGHCFAYGKVPAVPLTGCAHSGCTCHFRDIEERRSGLERRAGKERREDVRFEDKPDRRSGKDRRNSEGRYDWRFTA